MKRIAIYKYKPNIKDQEYAGKISSVGTLPDSKTDEEIKAAIELHNAEGDRVVTCELVSDDVWDAVQFLRKNRRLDLERHIEAIESIKCDISQIDDYLYDIVRDIKKYLDENSKSQ